MEALQQTLQGYMPAFLMAVTAVVLAAYLNISDYIKRHSHNKQKHNETIAEGVA